MLPVLDLPDHRALCPAAAMLWGDGFEIETVINCRFAAAGVDIVEVPSVELLRIHGHSNLNAVTDGFGCCARCGRSTPGDVRILRATPRAGPRSGIVGSMGIRGRSCRRAPSPRMGGVEPRGPRSAGRWSRTGDELELLTTDRNGRVPKVERQPTATPSGELRSYPRNRVYYVGPGLFLAVLAPRSTWSTSRVCTTAAPPEAMLAAWLQGAAPTC